MAGVVEMTASQVVIDRFVKLTMRYAMAKAKPVAGRKRLPLVSASDDHGGFEEVSRHVLVPDAQAERLSESELVQWAKDLANWLMSEVESFIQFAEFDLPKGMYIAERLSWPKAEASLSAFGWREGESTRIEFRVLARRDEYQHYAYHLI